MIDPPVAWTDPARIARALGPSVDTSDPYLSDVADAANEWAWRKRQEAGYTTDERDTAPSADVALGATLYAVGLYRERGSADSYASFDAIQGFAVTGTMGQINRLLGIGRARVDLPTSDPGLTTWRGFPMVNPLRHPAARGGPWVP